MRLPWWGYAIGVVALLVGARAALAVHDADVRRALLLADSLKVVHRSEAELRDSLARNGAAMHQDTVILVKWRTVYRTLRDTVLENVHDTIAVIRFVHTAESTIQACNQLVTDCQARTRILQDQVEDISQERDLYKRERPTFLMRHEAAVCTTTGVAGAILGAFVVKKF